ncbi:MAG TPA: hypothetical protein VL793_09045 [Patescibacteria group bacterium]|nr:hypothetical protein [Patescibacteria group bacterium]
MANGKVQVFCCAAIHDRHGSMRMIVLPVIEREMRAVARQALTYNLRALGVLALFCILCGFWLTGMDGSAVGGRLFGEFHRALFLGIWLFVPFTTADCISRERREGTLSLLFLTRLSNHDVVYAKGLVHGLRSLTLWLAVLPMFTICFLAGGVGWAEVAISASVNFSSICLALGAGLLASSRTRVWARSMAASALLGFALFLCFLSLLPQTLLISMSTQSLAGRLPTDEFGGTIENGLAMAMNEQGLWQKGLALVGSRPTPLLCSYGAAMMLSVCALYLMTRFTAWNLNRTWRDRPVSSRIQSLKDKLVKPVLFRNQLKTWLQWQLQRNPVGWLEQRSWSGRLVIWSWFAVVLCVYSSLFANIALYQRSFHLLQSLLATLLAASIAAAAAGSFRRERETGVLELLLVAPLRESQIIAGRVRGIWAQFLPAICLLFAIWFYGASFLVSGDEWPFVMGHALTFATLPVVGLYFSLVKPSFIAAFAWTLIVQIVIPGAGLFILSLEDSSESQLTNLGVQAAFQLAMATFLSWRLLVLLERRAFVTVSSASH